MSHIIAVHLLNDRSGSPLVLRQSLTVLAEAGYRIDLLTATPGEPGFLSDLPGVTTHALAYRWSASQWRTLLHFALVQWVVFWKVLRLAGSSSVVYVNSLLPAGAALAARCRGAQVVYHLHEVSLRPALLRQALCAVAQRTAHHLLCVSEHVRTTLALPVVQQQVVYNALPSSFIAEANRASLPYESPRPFVVLMACSLRDYKGVPEFFTLARSLPEMKFELVLNASLAAVAEYTSQHSVPNNLALFPATANMHPHYHRAAVVINLSRPDEWVETFGMTILEGLAYGRPVIVPPVGGVTEVNVHAHTGFAIDGRSLEALRHALRLLHRNGSVYARMAAAARKRADTFAPERFAEQVLHTFGKLLPLAPEFVSPTVHEATQPACTPHRELTQA
ncbi:glycosyltransferase family 4 protein [Hymenobacter setariae]|uniref:Glycosyltransferase family 4 protein n=1 Tax=Hymenobacter setariae TaxID=2594794 RepID=A0A558C483_9BACT|nr:glycosyltransferase family 4 protein [Hymenobacter setariae]TVT43574.1 glycosyltransferase family 4 protein [Hymenobacter setariae]